MLYNESSEKRQLRKTSSEKDEMFYDDSPVKTGGWYYVTRAYLFF